jgi:AcrR family transcriptional regulator
MLLRRGVQVARPRAPLLSRRRIAEAALELIDEDGLDHLTMRRLAKRLGVEGGSLYHHIASRDDLLDEMTAIINEEIASPPLDPEASWQTHIAEAARAYRRAFAGHPELLGPIMRRSVRTRSALTTYDRLFSILMGAGWDGAEASAIMAALDYLVLGSGLLRFSAGFERPAEDYAEDHPFLARALLASERATLDDRGFEVGLRALLAGLGEPTPGLALHQRPRQDSNLRPAD